MTEAAEVASTEEKEFTVEEKLEMLNQQIAFLIQAVVELEGRTAETESFLKFIFSLSADIKEEVADAEPKS